MEMIIIINAIFAAVSAVVFHEEWQKWAKMNPEPRGNVPVSDAMIYSAAATATSAGTALVLFMLK